MTLKRFASLSQRSPVWIALALVMLALVLLAAGGPAGAAQAPTRPDRPQPIPAIELPTDQIMVRFQGASDPGVLSAAGMDQLVDRMSAAAGVEMELARPMSGNAYVFRLPSKESVAEVAAISTNLMTLADVAEAAPDRIRMITDRPIAQTAPLAADLTPNDPSFSDQWHYRYNPGDNFDDATEEGLNLLPAWNVTTGSASTIVAVLDTGIRPHADLVGRYVGGYDFISNPATGNDGNGRDADPTDPGDWMPIGSCGGGFPPQPIDSSWHGTHVAGTIGASSNNGSGVSGVDWQAKIVPVRVLGRCGGTDSDIIDAMRWSAGLNVPGVPANPNPADVLNLSLGGSGSCDSFTQNAINDVVAVGTVVVVAAGNSGDNAGDYSPASCNNVITVAATTKFGDSSYYSNYGATIEVSAPGGETSFFESEGVLSTLNAGATSPGADSLAFYQGTSMAAPHVAGVVSLMKGLNPSLTPAQVTNILETTARDFPSYAGCNAATCGEGIVDAFKAVSAVQPPPPPGAHKSYIPVALDVSAPPPPPPSSLVNGNFEQGPGVGWAEFSSSDFDLVLNNFTGGGGQQVITPHSGSWAVWQGGGPNESSVLSQQITVSAATPFLTYYHSIGSSEETCGNDVAGVDVKGATVKSYNLCDATATGGDWVKQSINLAAYAGQTVLLEFWLETDGTLNSNWFLDDVAFSASAAAAGAPQSGASLGDASAPRAAK